MNVFEMIEVVVSGFALNCCGREVWFINFGFLLLIVICSLFLFLQSYNYNFASFKAIHSTTLIKIAFYHSLGKSCHR